MSDLIVRGCALLLAGVFAWAAVAKIARWRSWRDALHAYRLPDPAVLPVAVLTPVAEAAVVVALMGGALRVAGAATLALLAGFSAVVVRAQARHGRRLPCGCFGRSSDRDARYLLGRNVLLASLAIVVSLWGEDVAVVDPIRAPDLSEAVPIALSAAGVVAGVLLVGGLRSLRGPR